jgi:hypothetical protein
MKRVLLSLFCCLLAHGGAVRQARAQLTAQDTTSPDFFIFSENTYVAHPGATHVEVSVYFSPGNRGYSGWVDFATEDGTAMAGVHYQAVQGRLYFSGVNVQSFQVPILPHAHVGEPKTFQVLLSNPDAQIGESSSAVRIECAPSLAFSLQGSHLLISWPGACRDYVLEQSERTDFASTRDVATPPTLVDGRWQVEQPRSGSLVFYRLRKEVTAFAKAD